MKKLLLAVFAAELSLVAFPHTESEKLEVARRMTLFMHMSASYDDIDDLLANYREWGRPEVFFGINVAGWTVDEKKNAFDAYIRYIATTNCASEESPDHVASISAIEQCCWMSRTNELESIRQFVLQTQHPYRSRITEDVVALSPLDDVTTDFVEAIVTNMSRFARYERGGALARYEDKIIGADLSDPALSNACNKAVMMFYRNRRLSVVGADSFDPVHHQSPRRIRHELQQTRNGAVCPFADKLHTAVARILCGHYKSDPFVGPAAGGS
jgi:hypothetical protein